MQVSKVVKVIVLACALSLAVVVALASNKPEKKAATKAKPAACCQKDGKKANHAAPQAGETAAESCPMKQAGQNQATHKEGCCGGDSCCGGSCGGSGCTCDGSCHADKNAAHGQHKDGQKDSCCAGGACCSGGGESCAMKKGA